MLKWAARRTALWAVAFAVTLTVGAGSARATTTFDPATGTGFVPKADLSQYWPSGSRADDLRIAKGLSFWYGFYHEEEYAVTCPWGPARFFILYRTIYDLSERVVIRNGAPVGWKLLGRDGEARTSVSNMFEFPGGESCTVDALTATYDFVLLYVSHPFEGPAPDPYIWRQGEGVCFLASSGNPWAC